MNLAGLLFFSITYCFYGFILGGKPYIPSAQVLKGTALSPPVHPLAADNLELCANEGMVEVQFDPRGESTLILTEGLGKGFSEEVTFDMDFRGGRAI